MNAPPMQIAPWFGWRNKPWRLVERNIVAYRRMWYVFLSGFFEPLFFLLSIGIGVGKLIGGVHIGSAVVSYRAFVSPGLLATTAMTGAVLDTTFNFFVKFKYGHTYDAVLATPVGTRDVARGEVTWAVLRGGVYSAVFLLTIGLFGNIESWWAVFAVPAAMLISFAFAGAGLAGTTFMRSFVDFDIVNALMIPMFLFAATFFPITRYPGGLQLVIRCTPLYQGVAIERALILGHVGWVLLAHAAYLAVMGAVGVRIAGRRLGVLLQP